MTTEDAVGSTEFAARLRAARELRAISQGALATLALLPQSSIAHFEGGSRKPSFDNLRKLANALEVSTDYLLGRTDSIGTVERADPLFRHVENLTTTDRKLADEFLAILAERSRKTQSGE